MRFAAVVKFLLEGLFRKFTSMYIVQYLLLLYSVHQLTSLAISSGIVNVDVIQQNVFTTCVGSPLTMHWIGCPTYCVAVMIIEHMSSSTVVNMLWRRNTALSVLISWYLKYTLSPPSNLNMVELLKNWHKECAFLLS